MIALLEAHRAGLFARNQWLSNIAAGIVVGVVALPLAMAFAIASGACPEQGIYTAIFAGGWRRTSNCSASVTRRLNRSWRRRSIC